MTSSLISIIMPARNGEQYIEAALMSLLHHNAGELDIIVINDGSTDRTAEIVQRIAVIHAEVRMIPGPCRGVSSARNAGLAAVPKQAGYISFLDCDDLKASGSLMRQRQQLEQSPDKQYVLGLTEFFETVDEQSGWPAAGGRSAVHRTVQLGAALFRKKVFDQIGGFNEEMPQGEDGDFLLRLLEERLPYSIDDEIAVHYRRHAHNMTNDFLQVRRGFADAIRRSLARRRQTGKVADLGELFKPRSNIEEEFRHA